MSNTKNNYLDSLGSLLSKGVKIYNEYESYKKDSESFREKNEELFNNFKMFDKTYSIIKESLKSNPNQVFNTKTTDSKEYYYQILECSKSSSDKQIKENYKRLVKEYHPDTISSKKLPPAFIDFANNKFKEIQTAYEYIKAERNI